MSSQLLGQHYQLVLEIGPGGIIYTMEIRKHHKQGLFTSGNLVV